MLFAYIYVPHQMEKMQEFIDFVFYEVWCKAPIGLEFHPDLFKGKPELQGIMSEFGFAAQAPERGKEFYKDVKGIYVLFSSLSAQDIGQFKRWYQGNNNIESVCANDPATQVVRYSDIPVTHKKLVERLRAFFKDLYSKSLLGLAAIKDKIGDIDDHYKTFVATNNKKKCPFCGVNDLLGEYASKREAYDHYLPKALYPFNSINFRNLVPSCHHCNSSYKTSKDPAHPIKDPAGALQRRKVFYPYAMQAQSIEISVEIARTDVDGLCPEDIDLQFGPAALNEEILTWRDVYGIDERYKDKLCGPDAKDWIEQFRILNRRSKITADEYLEDIDTLDKFANSNFLKSAFVRACKNKGLLQTLEKYKN
ncbi:HNH endonuclease [Paraburkholderia youngii]|uniref:HNH endonuclease n=1 Tax=Paraburkholderia youngii TaxID=2782701 RepID=A0A7Y6K326_9BURK|nr:hypothetical protein [Paraburkholderia youngii]NUY03536.1 hypothetical protein [Paraburkholderia youngii]